MEVDEVKTIDDLYEEVKSYDLVFTAEASLADALNNRLEDPVLGHFATTPLLYVFSEHQNEKLAQERELFIELIQETDFSWKKSSYLLENIIECWQEQGSKEAIKEYSKFDNEDLEKVLDVIEQTKNVYSQMEHFEVEESKDVAVVNYHQFNELDRKAVPDDADEISIFRQGKEELPEFKIYNSATAIIQALKENITQENAEDIAIVAETDSKYTALIQSALREQNIPFLHQQDISESRELRLFLRILHLGLRKDRIKLKECRSVLTEIGEEIPVRRDNEYIKDIEGEVDDFCSLISEISQLTVGEALNMVSEFGLDCLSLREKLDEVGITDDQVSHEAVRRLEYYIDTYTIDSQGSSEGVLFVSPKAGAYVDKPIVFYLGMGSSWAPELQEKPWIDGKDREETNLKNFKALIQNGEQRHYLVQDKEMNEEVTPCLYFNTLADEDFESFTDARHQHYQMESGGSKNGFRKKDIDVEVQDFDALSPSTLDRLLECPRQCLFNWVVKTPDEVQLRKGNLLHHFAEFYVNYPDLVEDKGLEKFVEIMAEEIEPLVDDLKLGQMKTEFRIGARNLKNYLSSKEFEEAELEGFTNESGSNFFADYYNKDLTSKMTEVKFKNTDICVKGKTDLIPTSREMVDFKSTTSDSSKNSSPLKIVKNSRRDTDKPNFQAKLYLMALREANPDQKLEFTFFRFLSSIGKEISGGNVSMEDNLVKVTYYPGDLNAAIGSREAYEYVYSSKKRKQLLDKAGGFETYREIMENLNIPSDAQQSKDDIVSQCCEELADLFEARDELVIGYNEDYTRNQLEGVCETLLKKLIKFKSENFFKPELDEFEDFLRKQLDNLNEYQKSGFPLNGTDPEETHYQELIIK